MEDKERIKELNKEIDDLDQRIDNLKDDLEYYGRIGDHESYNELVSYLQRLGGVKQEESRGIQHFD